MKRILVGIDGSLESKSTADFAARLAKATGSSLTLLYVAPVPVPIGPEPYYAHGGLDEWDLAQREYAEALLREMSARCEKAGAEVETKLGWGPPAETLADTAEKENFDLVAVGHRGRGAVQRMLLGSVADRLAQISHKPVLVCRG